MELLRRSLTALVAAVAGCFRCLAAQTTFTSRIEAVRVDVLVTENGQSGPGTHAGRLRDSGQRCSTEGRSRQLRADSVECRACARYERKPSRAPAGPSADRWPYGSRWIEEGRSRRAGRLQPRGNAWHGLSENLDRVARRARSGTRRGFDVARRRESCRHDDSANRMSGDRS